MTLISLSLFSFLNALTSACYLLLSHSSLLSLPFGMGSTSHARARPFRRRCPRHRGRHPTRDRHPSFLTRSCSIHDSNIWEVRHNRAGSAESQSLPGPGGGLERRRVRGGRLVAVSRLCLRVDVLEQAPWMRCSPRWPTARPSRRHQGRPRLFQAACRRRERLHRRRVKACRSLRPVPHAGSRARTRSRTSLSHPQAAKSCSCNRRVVRSASDSYTASPSPLACVKDGPWWALGGLRHAVAATIRGRPTSQGTAPSWSRTSGHVAWVMPPWARIA